MAVDIRRIEDFVPTSLKWDRASKRQKRMEETKSVSFSCHRSDTE